MELQNYSSGSGHGIYFSWLVFHALFNLANTFLNQIQVFAEYPAAIDSSCPARAYGAAFNFPDRYAEKFAVIVSSVHSVSFKVGGY